MNDKRNSIIKVINQKGINKNLNINELIVIKMN